MTTAAEFETHLADEEDPYVSDEELPLDETSRQFVARLIDKCMSFMEVLVGHRLYPYQEEFARRIIESVVIEDAEELTALFSRQCLDGDTVVFRRDGSAVRLRDHEDAWSTDIRPVKRYQIHGGAEIIATDNHPVWTPSGWQPAGLLRPGDKVATLCRWDKWGSGKGADLARLVGYLVTDGSDRPRQSLKFTNTRRAYLTEVAEISDRLFGVQAKWYAKGNGFDLLLTTPQGQPNPLRDTYRGLDFDHGFPRAVLGWSREEVGEFINRAWSGDGCVRLKRGVPDLFLACGLDEVYARYWQSLLAKAGISSTVKSEWMTKSTAPFYRLVLGTASDNIAAFFDLVGDVYGKEASSQAVRAARRRKQPRPETWPCPGLSKHLYRDGYGGAPRGDCARCGSPNPRNSSGIGKGGAARTRSTWTEGDGEVFTWRRVDAITPLGEREVFDVEYLGKGWFVGNGIKVHNSGKSETVCDTVATLMILLPRLAKVFPDLLGKFKNGLWVGVFAPVEGQAETLFGRIVDRLTSERALEIMNDPEIDDAPVGSSRNIRLKKSGSTALMMTANPRAKIESKTFHLAVIDEAQDCFPASTPVLTTDGWVPIKQVADQPDRAWFAATQDSDGNLTYARVTTAYRTPRHTELLRVDHEHGSVYCTANHPFVVGDARVPARDLRAGAALSVVSGADQPAFSSGLSAGEDSRLHEELLAGVGAATPRGAAAVVRPGAEVGRFPEGPAEFEGLRLHDGEQPHDQPGVTGEDVVHLARDWAPPQGAGRQWSGADRAAAAALAASRSGLGGRACLPYWRAGQGRTAVALQDRPGQSHHDGGGGGRRDLALRGGTSVGGRAEGPVAVESRVVGVAVLEQGDPDFDRVCAESDFVYTLSVDADSHTYVAGGVLVGNCDDYVVRKSIHPMLASTAGTIVKTGTPTTRKGDFYKAIQLNKRRQTGRGRRQNHFEADWKVAAKYNPAYLKSVRKEMLRMGEDSDEFQMAFNLKWLLERGMFTTTTTMDELGDTSMELVRAWHRTPVVVGIDPARKQDTTVVTVVWVDWDRPDEFGYFDHRVLCWLELIGDDWEEQYFQIVSFLANYNVLAVGVDSQGVGDAVAQRLKILLPGTEVIAMPSNTPDQSKRWKHLMALMQRRMVTWPAHAKTRRLKTWQRFRQQMLDAEKIFQGPNMLVRAPDEAAAHDDYPDSLAIACALTLDLTMPEVQVTNNPFFG